MPIQILCIPLARRHLHFRYFLQIVLVVKAVSKHVTKVAQSALHRIRSSLLLGLLESGRLAFTVLDVTVANILVVCAIAQCDPHYRTQAERNLSICGVLVDKVDLHVLNRRAPAVEAEYLIREVDDLFRREVVNLAASSSRSRRDVLGS